MSDIERAGHVVGGDTGGKNPALRSREGWLPSLLLGIFVFVIHTISPTPQSGDSRLSAITAWEFFRKFDLHLEGYQVVDELIYRRDLLEYNGHILPYFPWPTMLLAAPADFVLALFGLGPENLSISNPSRVWLVEVPTASLMVAITAVVLRSVVLGFENRWSSKSTALLTALVFAFGTSAWSVGSRALWQQTASMLFLSLTVLALQRLDRSRWQAIFAGAWLGLALITRPTNIVAVAPFLLWICLRRRNAVVGVAIGFAIVLIPFLLISKAQYGQFLPPYYLPNRFEEKANFGFWESVGVNLVSPSRGLIIFDPVVILAIFGIVLSITKKTFSELDLAMAIACVGQLIVISSYGSTGGSTYGPRLMIDILPFIILLALPTLFLATQVFRSGTKSLSRIAGVCVVVLLVWGLFVNATGGLLRSGFCWSATPSHIDDQPQRVWDWSDPAFLRPYADIADGRSLGEVIAGSCTAE